MLAEMAPLETAHGLPHSQFKGIIGQRIDNGCYILTRNEHSTIPKCRSVGRVDIGKGVITMRADGIRSQRQPIVELCGKTSG